MNSKHEGYKDGLVENYVADFEMYDGDTSAVYTPTPKDRALIIDALHGFVAAHWPGVAAIRRAALEEAARVAELAPHRRGGMICGCSEGLADWTAAAIRALAEKEPTDD
jgi:hypothetical protein